MYLLGVSPGEGFVPGVINVPENLGIPRVCLGIGMDQCVAYLASPRLHVVLIPTPVDITPREGPPSQLGYTGVGWSGTTVYRGPTLSHCDLGIFPNAAREMISPHEAVKPYSGRYDELCRGRVVEMLRQCCADLQTPK